MLTLSRFLVLLKSAISWRICSTISHLVPVRRLSARSLYKYKIWLCGDSKLGSSLPGLLQWSLGSKLMGVALIFPSVGEVDLEDWCWVPFNEKRGNITCHCYITVTSSHDKHCHRNYNIPLLQTWMAALIPLLKLASGTAITMATVALATSIHLTS